METKERSFMEQLPDALNVRWVFNIMVGIGMIISGLIMIKSKDHIVVILGVFGAFWGITRVGEGLHDLSEILKKDKFICSEVNTNNVVSGTRPQN